MRASAARVLPADPRPTLGSAADHRPNLPVWREVFVPTPAYRGRGASHPANLPRRRRSASGRYSVTSTVGGSPASPSATAPRTSSAAAGSLDAERREQPRLVAPPPVAENVDDERRRGAQRVRARRPRRAGRELGAALNLGERRFVERNAQIVAELADAAVSVVAGRRARRPNGVARAAKRSCPSPRAKPNDATRERGVNASIATSVSSRTVPHGSVDRRDVEPERRRRSGASSRMPFASSSAQKRAGCAPRNRRGRRRGLSADELLVRQPAEEIQHVADARQVGPDEEVRLAFAQRRVERFYVPLLHLDEIAVHEMHGDA